MFLVCMMFPFRAHAGEQEVIRVGFLMQRGLEEHSGGTRYTGYTVDYLKELGKYADWKYQYVEANGDINTQMESLLSMLEKGEIDILGPVIDIDELRERFYYPTYNYGTTYTSLAVLEDANWMEEDYENWDGIRVAVCSAMVDREALLDHYASLNGFSYKKIDCETEEETLKAVSEGRADAVLQADISLQEGFRSIARFNPEPFYFLMSKKNPQLYRKVNQGLYSLLQTYPNLQNELYSRYFSYKGHFHLTDENREYIEGLGQVRVLFFKGSKPLQDVGEGGAGGVAAGFMGKLKENLGLDYTIVMAEDYEDGVDKLERGKVDLIAALPFNGRLATEKSLYLSHPYFESYGILVTNGKQNGVLDPSNFWSSANVEKTLAEMEKMPNSIHLLDANCVSFYTRKKGAYDNLHLNWGSTSVIRYSVGAVDAKYERLLTIINNYCNSLSKEKLQEMVYESAYDPVEYTFEELIYVYRYLVIALIALCFLILLVVLFFSKNKTLRKKALENERVFQFSKLTNECIFEYNYKEDVMNVQNSRVFYPGISYIPSYAAKYRYSEEDRHKMTHQYMLYQMLMEKQEQKDMLIDRPEGKRWFRIQIKYIGEKGDSALGRIYDISKEIETKKDLEKKASTDAMTGLLNRAAMERYITGYLQESDDVGVLILLDIDNFKTVNDTLGHSVGDRVICEFADILKKCFRSNDVKARQGGDEFLVFLPGDILEAHLEKKLQKVIDIFRKEVFVKYPTCNLSVSIGAAYSSKEIGDYDKLFRMADNAMYVVKFGGKNDYFIAEDEICMKKGCDNCKPHCKRRDYLVKKNVLKLGRENH